MSDKPFLREIGQVVLVLAENDPTRLQDRQIFPDPGALLLDRGGAFRNVENPYAGETGTRLEALLETTDEVVLPIDPVAVYEGISREHDVHALALCREVVEFDVRQAEGIQR